MKVKYFILTIIIFLFVSCEKMIFEDDVSNTPGNNFEIFWNDFNIYYPFFEIKNFKWDSVYSYYKPKVTTQTNSQQLFDILYEMIKPLKDGHVNLYSQYGTSHSYPMGIFTDYYSDNRIYPQNYLQSFGSNNPNINWWDVIGHNIGYISINTFQGQDGAFVFASESFIIIDDIVNQFKNKDGIIIDVRWNGGGLQPNAETIANRFTDEKRLYVKARSKNGSGNNDFSDWFDWYIEPKRSYQFTKPVVVLTSRSTGSTAEWFTLMMKTLPNVKTVGDTTNGSFSQHIYRELPNGWSFSLPTSIVASADLTVYEGVGIAPDFYILNTQHDFDNEIDAILEKGIEVIETNIK